MAHAVVNSLLECSICFRSFSRPSNASLWSHFLSAMYSKILTIDYVRCARGNGLFQPMNNKDYQRISLLKVWSQLSLQFSIVLLQRMIVISLLKYFYQLLGFTVQKCGQEHNQYKKITKNHVDLIKVERKKTTLFKDKLENDIRQVFGH